MDNITVIAPKRTFAHLPERFPVDIDFQDLTYTVPQGRKGSKIILRSVSGQFRSGELTAILGPSGSGKTTLLNVLAGYKSYGATGSVFINGKPRNLKQFRRISRYIMQEDLLQPWLTVQELMMIAADLKLSNAMKRQEKMRSINEILEMLRLINARNTITDKLSGGERKRLSIALELVNNPPVIFLDEPTTGLDDLASSQCITLLKGLAEGGRTVICSLHTPSARIFTMFDNVYVISDGQCAYQGYGPDVVTFLSNIGLICPTHYNPADFVIEVCSGEYGHFVDKMVRAAEQHVTHRKLATNIKEIKGDDSIIVRPIKNKIQSLEEYEYESSGWLQFKTLLFRMWLQMFRDKYHLLLKVTLHVVIGIFIGFVYYDIGYDGSRTIYNLGYCYTVCIFFLYVPLLPVLLNFPMQIRTLKREYFNRWYSLKAYFLALTVSTIPSTVILALIYVLFSYSLSGQPLELYRISVFYLICILTAFVSESIGLMISSILNVVNSIFVGPTISVPFMLLSVYGIGSEESNIPLLIKILMHFSYLRYSLEGIVTVIYGDRGKLQCPEDFCIFNDIDYFLKMMGMADKRVWVDLITLTAMFVVFRVICFFLIRQRLSPNKTIRALRVAVRLITNQLKLSR